MKSSELPPFKISQYLHPKYLPTWIGIAVMRLLAFLPYGVMLKLGYVLGWLTYYLMPGRRRIIGTNIALCFPDMPKAEQHRLMKECFYNSSIPILETPLAWWGSDKRLKALHKIEGMEHIEQAQKEGKGILLLGAHYTTLEMGARLLAYHMDEQPTYKRAHNKLYNDVMTRARIKVHGGAIPSADLRDIIKELKSGGIIWYAPDQDFGRNTSVFAPFMGVQTSTLTTTARLAKVSGARVLPMYSERLPGKQGYLVRIGQSLENFPSKNDVADASRVNQAIEEQVYRTPGQYLWGHRRFKTRPYGEPLIYPPRMEKSLRRYKLLMPILSFPMVLATLWLGYKFKNLTYIKQRLGFGNNKQQQNGLWLHAASVGEVNAVIPLIHRIHSENPGLPITLTTATPTGGDNAINKLPMGCKHHFMPLDWNWSSMKLIKQLQPSCIIVVETEMWPNLFWNFYRHNIPLVIINGRLSERTIQPRYVWVKLLYEFMSQQIRLVLARSKLDADRFAKLGTNEELIKVLGNIKFADTSLVRAEPIELGRAYILAASTRDDEEWRIVEAWQQSNAKNKLLTIVPRHPVRLEQILSQLDGRIDNIAVRSRDEKVTDQTQVYIADTFGELGGFIAGSEFVIMGGSFVPLGGQNILEVAQQNKAVIFGPHMDNFLDEACLFVEHKAAIQCTEPTELPEAINALHDDSTKCREMGDNGKNMLQSYSNILDDYLHELSKVCPCLTQKS